MWCNCLLAQIACIIIITAHLLYLSFKSKVVQRYFILFFFFFPENLKCKTFCVEMLVLQHLKKHLFIHLFIVSNILELNSLPLPIVCVHRKTDSVHYSWWAPCSCLLSLLNLITKGPQPLINDAKNLFLHHCPVLLSLTFCFLIWFLRSKRLTTTTKQRRYSHLYFIFFWYFKSIPLFFFKLRDWKTLQNWSGFFF